MTATNISTPPGPPDDHPDRSRRPAWELWAAPTLLTLVGIVLAVIAVDSVPSGAQGHLLVASRLGARAGAVVTVGLILALVLVKGEEDRRLLLGEQGTTTVLRLASVAAGLWCASATLEVGLRYQALEGEEIWEDMAASAGFLLGDGVGAIYALQAGVTFVLLGLLVLALRAPRWGDVVRLLAMTVLAAATLPLLLVYKMVPAGVDEDGNEVLMLVPPSATISDAIHVLGALLWTGGLLGLLVALWLTWRSRTLPPRKGFTSATAASPKQREAQGVLAGAVERYSNLVALPAALLVTSSGLLMAWSTLRVWWPEDWRDDPKLKVYMALVLVKLAATLVLLAFGYVHRRWTIKRLKDGRPAHFAYLAGVEVTIMLLVVALGVLLVFNGLH